MNDAGLFDGPKWELMQEIATTSQSPTRLAKKLHTSIPNVLHHLKLLEAYGIVASSTTRTRNSGKPPTIYGLVKPLAFISILDEFGGKRKTLNPNHRERFFIRSMLDFKEEWANALTIIAIEHPEILQDNTAMALINKKENSADLLLITQDIELFRTKKNKLSAKIGEKEITITVWSHTKEEYIEGIKNQEVYFMKFLKAQIIHDPKSFLNGVKDEGTK